MISLDQTQCSPVPKLVSQTNLLAPTTFSFGTAGLVLCNGKGLTCETRPLFPDVCSPPLPTIISSLVCPLGVRV